MTFPPNLNILVDRLAVATKKASRLEVELAKLEEASKEVQTIREQLRLQLEALGFPDEAVDLLLAAR